MDDAIHACERHQVALEQRLAGDLAPQAASELEAHVAQCEPCQRYARQMERIQAMVTASNVRIEMNPHRKPVTGYRVRRQVRASRDVARYSMATLLFLSLSVLIDGLDGSGGPGWLGIAALVMTPLTIAAMAYDSRAMRRLAEAPGDVLRLSQSEVRTRSMFVRTLSFVLALLGVFAFGSGLEHAPAWMPTFGTASLGAPYLWLGILLLVASLFAVLVVLPRLRRELAEYE